MSVGVNPPRTPVTKGSSGIAVASIPNPCKMPGPPAPFIVTPLPNIGTSDNSPSGYSTSVTIEGNAVAIHGATFNSKGDVASQGTGGGLVSSNVQGPTNFVAPGSLDVSIEGKAVQLLGDQMLSNCAAGGSPPNSACASGVAQMNFMKGAQFPKPGKGIDCAQNCKPRPQGKGWGDCELKQACAKAKALNEAGAKGDFQAVPGASKKPEYKAGIDRFQSNFAIGAAPENSPLFEEWVKDQFYDECAYAKWKNGDPPCKCAGDLNPSSRPIDPATGKAQKGTAEAFNPDHMHDAGLGGSLEAMWNLKWMDSSVNKSFGGMMGGYDPEKDGKIVLDQSCKCDS